MKTNVLSALLLLPVALPTLSWAQAPTEGVVINGIIDAGLRYDQGGTAGSIKSLGSGLAQGSRLAFSGIEGLGGDLRAAFVLEMGFATDTGAGAANTPGTPAGGMSFGRTSAIALGSDGMGYVSLGRQYTPMWALIAGPALDPFGGTWFGGPSTVYTFANRNVSNSIVYSYGYTARTMLLPAPRTGLGVAVMYALPETSAPLPSQAGQQLGFNVSYGFGNWWAGYAYHQIKGSNNQNPVAPGTVTSTPTDSPELKINALGAAYQWDALRFFAGINTGKNGLPGTNATATDRRSYHLGVQANLGSHVIRAIYGDANERVRSNSDFSTVQIGYQYNLSKRTNVYAAYGLLDNDSNTSVALSGSVGAYAKGSTPKSTIAGLRHNF